LKKNCDISKHVLPILLKFGTLVHVGLPDTLGQNHSNFKNPRWQMADILKITKNRDMSKTI